MLKELRPEFEPRLWHGVVSVILTLLLLPLLMALVAMAATYYWIGSKIAASKALAPLRLAARKYKDRLFHHSLE